MSQAPGAQDSPLPPISATCRMEVFPGEWAGAPSPKPSLVTWVEGAPPSLPLSLSVWRDRERRMETGKSRAKGAWVGVWLEPACSPPRSSRDGHPASAGPGPLLCPTAGCPAEPLTIQGQQPILARPPYPSGCLQSISMGLTLCWAPGQRPPRPVLGQLPQSQLARKQGWKGTEWA